MSPARETALVWASLVVLLLIGVVLLGLAWGLEWLW